MKSRNTSGFTLIELLVVIAIIGILAAVVLASLNSAREKGKVANIKSNLRNAVTQAALHYSDNGSYSTLCSSTTITSIVSSLTNAGAEARCIAYSEDWGIGVIFNTNQFYTAGPVGILTLDAADAASGGVQTWVNAVSTCATTGRRLPSASAIRALYDIGAVAPASFAASYYWSSTENTLDAAQAYIGYMNASAIGSFVKTNTYRVRCGA